MASDIIAGFDEDCQNLLIRFEKESSVRFSTFAEIWRDMHFSLVYADRSLKHVLLFASEAFKLVKNFFINTNSFLRKVCAIYILYGMYYKQPIKNAVKIQIRLEEWLIIRDFIIALKENDHYDTLYIILKLVFDNAFEFSALDSNRYNPVKTQSKNSVKDIVDTKPLLKSLDIDDLLSSLKGVEEDYEVAKTELAESMSIPPIQYSSSRLTETLTEILNDESYLLPSKVPVPGPSTSKPQPKKSIAERRRKIREKSFGKKNKSSLFRSVVYDSEDEDDL